MAPKKVCEIAGCNGCPMRELFPDNNFVPPKMGIGKRLVVAEAPGETEATLGEPLIGTSGQLFNGQLAKAGISRDNLTIINTIQCRPPDNKYPTSPDGRAYISKLDAEKSVSHCYDSHVKPVLKGREWQRIDLLGDHALHAVTGRRGIYNWRGLITEATDLPGRQIVVPTIHPAAIMRDQTMYPVVISDLKKSLIQPPEKYNLYPSVTELEAFVSNTREFCFDIETNRFTGEIYMVGLAKSPFNALVVPYKAPYLPLLKQLFRQATSIIGQNIIQFDLEVLERVGIIPSADATIWDTMLMHHLVSPDLPHDLEFISSIYTNKAAWKHLAEDNKELYCARDTDVTLQIFPQLKALLKQFQLEDIYHLVSVPVSKICGLMRQTGVKCDKEQVNIVRERLKEASRVLEQSLPDSLKSQTVPINRRIPAPPGTLSEKSGKPLKFLTVPSSKEVVPWRSDVAVGKYLYEEKSYPTQYHVKTKEVTTDKIALDKLFRLTGDKAIQAIKKLRGIDETLTTFAKEKMAHGASIHSHFNVHGTSSGRLSSSDPNLQNIPEAARCIYVPHHAGWKIVSADYSQIENRLTAYLANDVERLRRFSDLGFSEHKWAASQFFSIPYDEVEKDNDKEAPYGKAKRIVHGTNYGMGPRKIAMINDLVEKDVKQLQATWKAAILKTSTWQEATAALAKKDGFLVTPFGRKRWFYTSSYYTESLSFIPQSTAADCILRAMVGLLYERVNWPIAKAMAVSPIVCPIPKPVNLLVQVHDSLVFECPEEMVDVVVNCIKKVMEQPWKELAGFSCPVSVEVGDNWGELEPYKEIK